MVGLTKWCRDQINIVTTKWLLRPNIYSHQMNAAIKLLSCNQRVVVIKSCRYQMLAAMKQLPSPSERSDQMISAINWLARLNGFQSQMHAVVKGCQDQKVIATEKVIAVNEWPQLKENVGIHKHVPTFNADTRDSREQPQSINMSQPKVFATL